MLSAVWGVVREGKIESLEPMRMPEGARVLITVLDDANDDVQFWQRLSEDALKAVWDNHEDDVYADLLKR